MSIFRKKKDPDYEVEVYPLALNNEEVLEKGLDEFRELIEELNYEGVHLNLPNLDIIFGSMYDQTMAYPRLKEVYDFVSIPVQKAYVDSRNLRSNNLDKMNYEN